MGALGEGYHVDEGRRCWKRREHGCKGGWNGVQLSVLIRVDHFAVEGEGRKELRLPESSIAVLGACRCRTRLFSSRTRSPASTHNNNY